MDLQEKLLNSSASGDSERDSSSDSRLDWPEPAEVPDAKSIILFSDGTGNSSGKLFKTNVWRLYEAVHLGPGAPGEQRQLAYYDDGVGTSAFRPLRMLQGIFGIGLKRNVLDIYSHACRNYDPGSRPVEGSGIQEPGDHIYGFGFSRGAFTMRLVIGMIADQGLIPYTNEADLKWKVQEAYDCFNRNRFPRVIAYVLKLLGRDTAADAETLDDQTRTRPGITPSGERKYDPKENHRPTIRFIGVWDTVAAYGGPIVELTRAIDNWVYRLSMPNYTLHPRVRCARHALALDDERDSFHPLLWDEAAEEELKQSAPPEVAPWLQSDRLKQVWFAGMHADVGGGYPDESLSYVSLLWMIEEARKCGLRTLDLVTDRYCALANSFGPIHDSRAGLAGYYRYQPRRVSAWTDQQSDVATLGLRDPDIRDAQGKPKGLLRQVVVHESVVARIASGTDGYAPIVLPADYQVLPPGEFIETSFQETTGARKLTPEEAAAAAAAPPPPLLPPHVPGWLQNSVKQDVAEAMKDVWSLVWWRRVVYFLTVGLTLALLLMPFGIARRIVEATSAEALEGHPLIDKLSDGLGNLINVPGVFVPGPWFDSWAQSPFWFLGLLLGSIFGLAIGARLERRIQDRSRNIWHTALPRIPPWSSTRVPGTFEPHKPSWLGRARNSYTYQKVVQVTKWRILPNFLIGPAMLLGLAWMLLALITMLIAPFLEGRGAACVGKEPTRQLRMVQFDFLTKQPCNQPGYFVAGTVRYRINLEIVDNWEIGSRTASPAGLSASQLPSGSGYAGAPFRRVLDANYFETVVAIRLPRKEGSPLGSVHVQRLNWVEVSGQPGSFEATFEAAASGELYLFANDSILPFNLHAFYGNNRGSACVTIREVGAKVPHVAGTEPVCSTAARKAERVRAEQGRKGPTLSSPTPVTVQAR